MLFKVTRSLVFSLIFPISALAQTPASSLDVNPNMPDISGLFVEVLTEMQQPTPAEAIGPPDNLATPSVSSVLPMPSITPQQPPVTTAPANPQNEPVDPPVNTNASSSSDETFTTLEGAQSAMAELKRENAQLQERLNNLNKQMLELRQSFQQANSALLQRINQLQAVEQSTPPMTNQPQMSMMENEVPLSRENPAQIVPMPPVVPSVAADQTPAQGSQQGVSLGSPEWQAAMEQQRQEEQQRKQEEQQRQQALQQQQQQALQQQPQKQPPSQVVPATEKTYTIAPPDQVQQAAKPKNTALNTALKGETAAGGIGIKEKLLALLNDTGFVLKLGIGLAVLGFLWLLLTMMLGAKKSKKEEYEDDLFDSYASEEEEPKLQTESEDWEAETGNIEPEISQTSYAEPEYKYEETHEDELEDEDEDEEEYTYHHPEEPTFGQKTLGEDEDEDEEDEGEEGAEGEGESEHEEQNDESFFIADEELDREDMLEEESDTAADTDTASHGYDFSEQVEDTDNVSIKLDLARAYLEMRDFGTAEEVLNTVLHQGTSDQQREAQNLMDELKVAQSE